MYTATFSHISVYCDCLFHIQQASHLWWKKCIRVTRLNFHRGHILPNFHRPFSYKSKILVFYQEIQSIFLSHTVDWNSSFWLQVYYRIGAFSTSRHVQYSARIRLFARVFSVLFTRGISSATTSESEKGYVRSSILDVLENGVCIDLTSDSSKPNCCPISHYLYHILQFC